MYVVTGATGNTGHIVAQKLLANGQKVRAIGRSADRLQAIAAEGAEPFIADLIDKQALTKAFTGARAVYAMVPPPSAYTQDYRAYQDRISDAIAAALTAAKVPYAVTLSSFGADKPGKTGLPCKQLPDEQVRAGMTQMGMSLDMANLILEMAAALNSGYMRTLEPRSPRNTTPTSYEVFVAEQFVPLYQRKTRAA